MKFKVGALKTCHPNRFRIEGAVRKDGTRRNNLMRSRTTPSSLLLWIRFRVQSEVEIPVVAQTLAWYSDELGERR